jgi:hypothetical protein
MAIEHAAGQAHPDAQLAVDAAPAQQPPQVERAGQAVGGTEGVMGRAVDQLAEPLQFVDGKWGRDAKGVSLQPGLQALQADDAQADPEQRQHHHRGQEGAAVRGGEDEELLEFMGEALHGAGWNSEAGTI